MMDMGVPGHAHQDEHMPRKLTVTGSWHTSFCDEFEGWPDDDEKNIDADGFMVFEDNWYWDGMNTYLEKGGLLDISSETNPLLYLMYTTNQIADFFASDDIDGNSELWNDSSVQSANLFLQSVFNDLESQGYTSLHPTRVHHEMTFDDCAQIRNEVFPFTLQSVATFLEYIAQEFNLASNYVPAPLRDVQGHLVLANGNADITNAVIKKINPDNALF